MVSAQPTTTRIQVRRGLVRDSNKATPPCCIESSLVSSKTTTPTCWSEATTTAYSHKVRVRARVRLRGTHKYRQQTFRCDKPKKVAWRTKTSCVKYKPFVAVPAREPNQTRLNRVKPKVVSFYEGLYVYSAMLNTASKLTRLNVVVVQ